jgi:putative transposase
MHCVRVGGRFGAERAHCSGLPPISLSRLRQAFQQRSAGSLNRTQYSSDVIVLVVLWRLRYKLALPDLPEVFLIRGIVFSHEAVGDWEAQVLAGVG